MESHKLAVCSAKAMDDIERLVESGSIPEDSRIGAVLIVVACDYLTPDEAEDRDEIRDVSTQCFVFAEPEEIYVQLGLLEMARDNWVEQ